MASIRDSVKNKKNVQPAVSSLIDKHQQREASRSRDNRNNRPQRQASNNSQYREQRPSYDVYPYFKDGVDHINIWSRGETPLGRALSMEATMNLKTRYGEFRNAYALWVFLTTKDHPIEIASWDDAQLRRWVRIRVDLDKEIDLLNARYVCVSELAKYITSNKALMVSLMDSRDACLDSYVVHGLHGKFPHQHREWWVGAINLIRAQLLAGVTVDISTFLETTESDYPDIRPTKLQRLGDIPLVEESTKKPNRRKHKKDKKPEVVEKPAEAADQQEALIPGVGVPLQTFINPDPTMVLWFSTEENRREAMLSLIKTGTTVIDNSSGEMKFALYVWLDADNSVKTISTDVFENPFDYQKEPKQVFQTMEEMIASARRELNIPDHVPDEAIHLHMIAPRKVKPRERDIVIRDETFSNEGDVTFAEPQTPVGPEEGFVPEEVTE